MQKAANMETILLVDDEDEVRQVMRQILENAGFIVLEAGNYYQALDVARDFEDKIDLLVADVSLPGPNGCEIANRLLQSRPDCQVLFISGYTGAEILVHYGIALNDLHFMAKPIDPKRFVERVTTILGVAAKHARALRQSAEAARKRLRRA